MICSKQLQHIHTNSVSPKCWEDGWTCFWKRVPHGWGILRVSLLLDYLLRNGWGEAVLHSAWDYTRTLWILKSFEPLGNCKLLSSKQNTFCFPSGPCPEPCPVILKPQPPSFGTRFPAKKIDLTKNCWPRQTVRCGWRPKSLFNRGFFVYSDKLDLELKGHTKLFGWYLQSQLHSWHDLWLVYDTARFAK